MRNDEVVEILGSMDESLKAAMDAVGDDLTKYLKEVGEEFPEDIKKKEQAEKEAKEEKLAGAAEPFIAIFKGFKEMFTAFAPSLAFKSKPGKSEFEMKKSSKKAQGAMELAMYQTYKNFKKAHGMRHW